MGLNELKPGFLIATKNYNSKSENKLGYFKIKIQKAYSPIYFDNAKKLNCITF